MNQSKGNLNLKNALTISKKVKDWAREARALEVHVDSFACLKVKIHPNE
jgi:hypothetical protein